MLTELRNRGVNDVCIVVCDGLKGLPDAITTTWPRAVVQTCVLHLIRNSFRLASRQHWDRWPATCGRSTPRRTGRATRVAVRDACVRLRCG